LLLCSFHQIQRFPLQLTIALIFIIDFFLLCQQRLAVAPTKSESPLQNAIHVEQGSDELPDAMRAFN